MVALDRGWKACSRLDLVEPSCGSLARSGRVRLRRIGSRTSSAGSLADRPASTQHLCVRSSIVTVAPRIVAAKVGRCCVVRQTECRWPRRDRECCDPRSMIRSKMPFKSDTVSARTAARFVVSRTSAAKSKSCTKGALRRSASSGRDPNERRALSQASFGSGSVPQTPREPLLGVRASFHCSWRIAKARGDCITSVVRDPAAAGFRSSGRILSESGASESPSSMPATSASVAARSLSRPSGRTASPARSFPATGQRTEPASLPRRQ